MNAPLETVVGFNAYLNELALRAVLLRRHASLERQVVLLMFGPDTCPATSRTPLLWILRTWLGYCLVYYEWLDPETMEALDCA